MYASDLTDNATIKNAVENGGESSEQGVAIHMQKLADSSFKTEDEKPQVRSVIYDTDLYLSCKDDTLGWQTKRYSLADGGVYDDTVDYYDSFGTDCFTYMGTDDQYHVQSYDKSWDYTVDREVIDSAVVGDLAVFVCSDENDNNTNNIENTDNTVEDKTCELYYYRSGADNELKKEKTEGYFGITVL